jgi:hypothetical protein
MEDENIVYENINPEDDNERYFLTPWGCLCCAFGDFSLKPPEISGKMADALMDDFFEIMEAAGILEKKENDDY